VPSLAFLAPVDDCDHVAAEERCRIDLANRLGTLRRCGGYPTPDHDDLVFSTQGNTNRAEECGPVACRIASRAGLARASLHTLRHSAASALIASSVHVRIFQEVLGHSSYAVTADTYAHIAVAQQREAAERLGKAFPW
jgi:integrase